MSITYKFELRCNELYAFIHNEDKKLRSNQGLYNWVSHQKKEYTSGRLDKDKEDRLRQVVKDIFEYPIQQAIDIQIQREKTEKINNALRIYGIDGLDELLSIYRLNLDGDMQSRAVWKKLLYTIKQIKNNTELVNNLREATNYAYDSVANTLHSGSILLAKSLCDDSDLIVNIAYNIERFSLQLREYIGESRYSIIYKKYYTGMSYSDIAKQLNVSRALISHKALQVIKQFRSQDMLEALSGDHIEYLPSALFGQIKLNRILNTKYKDSVHGIINIIRKSFNLTPVSDEYILGKLYLTLDINIGEIDKIIMSLKDESDEFKIGYDSIFNQGKNLPNGINAGKFEQMFIAKLSVLSYKCNPNIDICILKMPRSIEKKFKSVGVTTINQLIQYCNSYNGGLHDEMYEYVGYIHRKIFRKSIDENKICTLNISDILYHKLITNGIDTIDKLRAAIASGDIYKIKGIGKSKVDILINAIS